MNNIESEFGFYRFKKCIDPKQISWWQLVTRKDTIPLIEKYIDILDKDCLGKLSKNPFAVDMLKRHIDKISWDYFVMNPNAMQVIDENFDKCIKSLCWSGKISLLRHSKFVNIINKHTDKIIDEVLCGNCLFILATSSNPTYIELLEKYMEKYSEQIEIKPPSITFWMELSGNPYTVHILEKHLEKLDHQCWNLLAKNTNAIHIVEKNQNKLDNDGWRNLSKNKNAIHILEKNPEKINWFSLANNPNGFKILEKYPEKKVIYSFFDDKNLSVTTPIFEIDYDAIEKRCAIYKEELMQIALHPYRIEHYLNMGIPVEELDNYI
jgi:hypothetical protein